MVTSEVLVNGWLVVGTERAWHGWVFQPEAAAIRTARNRCWVLQGRAIAIGPRLHGAVR